MNTGVMYLGPFELSAQEGGSQLAPVPGRFSQQVGDSIQISICRIAISGGLGDLNILGLVETERNSWMQGHGITQGAVPSAKRFIAKAAAS